MLNIQKRRGSTKRTTIMSITALLLIGGGLYLLTLVSAPAVVPYFATPITPESLPEPQARDNRIIIPKIGVNIPYGPDEASLDTGAWWRHSDRGNPDDGGNFVIAAHRFTLWSTIQQTIEKSPFYNIDKLAIDDQVIVDYDGKRYLYSIDRIFDVKPSQVEIEAPSDTPKLTLYTCTLGGAVDGRVVMTATPEGEVLVDSSVEQ